MITLGFWVSLNNKVNSIQYGFLNATGTTFIDTGNSKCVHEGSVQFVCCVDSISYLASVCPLVFDSNNYCVPPDSSHSKGGMCVYSKMLSLKVQTGFYVKCTKTACDQSVELYNQCEVYTFKEKEFMYCSNTNVLMNQQTSFDFSYSPGYYNVVDFDNGAKYYKVSDLPTMTKNELESNQEIVGRRKIAFIVLIVMSFCLFVLGLILSKFD